MKSLVLAIQTTSRGCGWVAFESPLSIVDWGTMEARPSRSGHILNRIERLLQRYQPAIVVISEAGRTETRRSPSVARRQQRIVALAETLGIHVVQYDRQDVLTCFKHLGAPTRYEIARFIAQHVDALRQKLPRRQKIWNGESMAMSVFDAAALAYTYFAINGERP